MNGKRNRQWGHKFEQDIARWWRTLGFGCVTSRAESKSLDDAGIDLVLDAPFDCQLKATEKLGSAHTILAKMKPRKGRYKALFHKRKRQGVTVTLSLEDFGEIISKLKKDGIF